MIGMTMSSDPALYRGVVTTVGDEFGFIQINDDPSKTVYFKRQWCPDGFAIEAGSELEFHIREFEGGNLTAAKIRLLGGSVSSGETLYPRSPRLLDWAYLESFPDVLNRLSEMALPEDWEFKNSSNPSQPLPILYNYLLQTFARLAFEKKVLIDDSSSYAVFNTGLVDNIYKPIYALFRRQRNPIFPWLFWDFCKAAEGTTGKQLVRHFHPLPERAHYFEDPADVLYHPAAGIPQVDLAHVVVDNISRWPAEFIETNLPNGFATVPTDGLSEEESKQYFEELGKAIQADAAAYRAYTSRFESALELAVKRVSWNFKTAVPMYYPTVQKVQLLLPLCIMRDDVVDTSLAVERTPSGQYLGHTILPLDWAYNNARLVCRPDSDWLTPKGIREDMPDNS